MTHKSYLCQECHRLPVRCLCKRFNNEGGYRSAEALDEVQAEEARCQSDRDRKVMYRVKPYEWKLSTAGREGTSYCIEEVRVIATSRNEDDAMKIVRALNENKRMHEQLECAKSKLVHMSSALERANASGLYETEVFAALRTAIDRLPHARWSSHRKQIVAFAKNVAQALHLNGKLEG